MAIRHTSDTKWNIFARELEAILATRGLRLGHLNDRAAIHPEKVRRLQRSLLMARFHVLSPSELDRVCDVFQFTEDERTRLRAALLATAIEEMLMDRIHQNDALAAAEEVFPILYRALRGHAGEVSGMGAVKGLPELELAAESDRALEPALMEIDAGLLALHMAIAPQRAGHMTFAHAARDHFQSALGLLRALDPATQATSAWRAWQADAAAGLSAADHLLGHGAR